MAVFLFSIGILALFFILMSVRLIFIKNGEFRGTCASQSPWLSKDGITCNYCGKNFKDGEACGEVSESNLPLPKVKQEKNI